MTALSRVRIKFCGLTRADDVRAAVSAGADALGLVFYPPSPRAVSVDIALQLAMAAGPFVQVTGLFVDPDAELLNEVCHAVPLELIQFHGEESPEQCRTLAARVGRRWIKALAVPPSMTAADLLVRVGEYRAAGASGVLLDAWHPQLKGGTGQTLDWASLPELDCPWILAGGLTADNVMQAILQTRPYAVDVSGGIEAVDAVSGAACKGIKSPTAMREFAAAVQAASQHQTTATVTSV